MSVKKEGRVPIEVEVMYSVLIASTREGEQETYETLRLRISESITRQPTQGLRSHHNDPH
jgi:hypothetical protein